VEDGAAVARDAGPGRTAIRDEPRGCCPFPQFSSSLPFPIWQANLRKQRRTGSRNAAGRWKLEDAKARFSEMVRQAREDGPQRVTVRGHDAVIVMSVEEFERLVPPEPRPPLLEFMESLHLGGLDLEREMDRGRDVEL